MTIQVSCNNCGKIYNVSDNIAGRKIRCKECETIIHVPEAEAVEEVDAWEDDDEFGDEFGSQEALPPRRRRSSGPAYDDMPPQRSGLSGTQIVLMVVGGCFLLLLLACGGLAYVVIEKTQEVIAEVQEEIENAEAEAQAAREQRATEMAEAELAPLDLAEVGLPLVIDMPEGTTVSAENNPNLIGEEGANTLIVYFHYGSLIEWQMNKDPEYETIEDLKKYVMETNDVLPKDIEVVDDKVVIYKNEFFDDFNDGAAYNFMALVTVGENRLLFQDAAYEFYTREEVDFFASCIQTLRPEDQAGEEAPAGETSGEAASQEEAAPTEETPQEENEDK